MLIDASSCAWRTLIAIATVKAEVKRSVCTRVTPLGANVIPIPTLNALMPLLILLIPSVASIVRCFTMVTGAVSDPARNNKDSSW